MYLIGQPVLKIQERDRFLAPVGQAHLCQAVLRESNSTDALRHLQEEYVAIVLAFAEMGIDFRIVFSHPEMVDMGVIGTLIRMGCRLAGFGKDFFPPSVTYPRDFATVLPGLVLFNQNIRVVTPEKNGCKLIVSPFGEGGRVLLAEKTMLVSERVCERDRFSRQIKREEVAVVEEHGITVGFFPVPACQYFDKSALSDRVAFSDHLDRVATLIVDKAGFLNLIIDPHCMVARMVDEATRRWEPIPPDETYALLADRFKPLGIRVHRAPELEVPCSLNLLQVPDGRVLMTGGEDGLYEFVSSLVGRNKVVETEVPIRYIPTYLYAGIRCLIAEAPGPLMIKKV